MVEQSRYDSLHPKNNCTLVAVGSLHAEILSNIRKPFGESADKTVSALVRGCQALPLSSSEKQVENQNARHFEHARFVISYIEIIWTFNPLIIQHSSRKINRRILLFY